MQAFEYTSPLTKEVAVKLLSGQPGYTAVLAGGTDLLSLMKDYVLHPRRVVNIKSITELGGIVSDGREVRIGALVTLAELLENDRIEKEFPSLAQAAAGVGSPQIQNMGTVAGDLCQRPRCWYFRGGCGLLATKDGQSMIPGGDNRYHAILGNDGPAKFVSPSSLAPALIALGAKIQIYGPGGEREVKVEQFYRAPVSDDQREYALASDELIATVVIPRTRRKQATYEVRQREGHRLAPGDRFGHV